MPMRLYRWLVIVLAMSAAEPAYSADAEHGEQLARRWCSPCHVVASNQRTTTAEAPPFATIARRPDFSANRIAAFLLAPHPKMPDMALSRAEAADLAEYIASLR